MYGEVYQNPDGTWAWRLNDAVSAIAVSPPKTTYETRDLAAAALHHVTASGLPVTVTFTPTSHA